MSFCGSFRAFCEIMRKDDIQLSSLPCYNKRMKYEIIRTETMRLVGFAARTNNGAPDCGAVIGSLWQKYFKAFGYARASYCVYTDYAGDETDD